MLMMLRSLSSRTKLAVFAFALALGTGCGGGIGAYCEEASLCEEGNDADLSACEAVFDTQADLADLRNCTSEFDEYFECLEINSRCNGDRYRPDDDDCDSEWDRYRNCVE